MVLYLYKYKQVPGTVPPKFCLCDDYQVQGTVLVQVLVPGTGTEKKERSTSSTNNEASKFSLKEALTPRSSVPGTVPTDSIVGH